MRLDTGRAKAPPRGGHLRAHVYKEHAEARREAGLAPMTVDELNRRSTWELIREIHTLREAAEVSLWASLNGR